jgi:hypothetical protein
VIKGALGLGGGLGSIDGCLPSYAHPELSRGGMCVRVKKWREDAQPEWPEAASAQDPSATGQGTQAFPETGGTGIANRAVSGIPGGDGRPVSVTGATERLGQGVRGFPDAGRTDGTDVLASAGMLPGRSESTGRTAAVRDPWEEFGASGSGHDVPAGGDPAHDPHEVTVQLDDIGPQMEELLVRQAKGAGPLGGQDGSDGPVFVDESGRRSRRFRRMGIAVGLACSVYAVVIVATLLSGNSNAPWLPVPGQQEGQPAGKVDTPSRPADSAPPSGTTGRVVPGTTPTAGQGTASAPAPGVTKPGAGTSPGKPGTSADPQPSPTASVPGPGPGSSGPHPTPTATVTVTDPPDPTPTGTTPSPTPTETPGTGDSAGPVPVADGPGAPKPIATEPGTTAPASSPPTAPIT